MEWDGQRTWSGYPLLVSLIEHLVSKGAGEPVRITPTGPWVKPSLDDPRSILAAIDGFRINGPFEAVEVEGEMPPLALRWRALGGREHHLLNLIPLRPRMPGRLW